MKEEYWAEIGRALSAFLLILSLIWFIGFVNGVFYENKHGKLIDIQECILIEGNFSQSYHIYKDENEIESYSTGIKNGYYECNYEEVREMDMWKRINLEKEIRNSGGKRK